MGGTRHSHASPSSVPATSARRTPSAWPCSGTTCSVSTSTGPRSTRSHEGQVPFFEPGLPELLRKALDSGRLSFTTDLAEAGDFGDVHFICVGTPQKPGSDAADLRYVEGVTRDLAPYLRRRCLVVGKSTVPVGTAARLTRIAAGQRPCRRRGRAGVEPRVPARGVRDRGHPAPGPAGLRRRLRLGGGDPAHHLRTAHRRRGPGGRHRPGRPRSWSRWPRTPSWPPRSPTSTRWPRSARRPVPTSRTSPTRSPTTPASAAGSCTPASGSAAAACPRTSGRSSHRAEEIGVGQVGGVPAAGRRDQPASSGSHRGPGARAGRRLAGRGPGVLPGRRLQAQLRRHP